MPNRPRVCDRAKQLAESTAFWVGRCRLCLFTSSFEEIREFGSHFSPSCDLHRAQGENQDKFDKVDLNGEQAEDAEIGKGMSRIGIPVTDVLGKDGLSKSPSYTVVVNCNNSMNNRITRLPPV